MRKSRSTLLLVFAALLFDRFSVPAEGVTETARKRLASLPYQASAPFLEGKQNKNISTIQFVRMRGNVAGNVVDDAGVWHDLPLRTHLPRPVS